MTPPPPHPGRARDTDLAVPIREYRLDNGLRVVISEDHAAPIVAVNVWYHVGSKNERAGRTGFAHLFEHLLFQGSEHVGDDQHFALIQQRGGTANGSTWFDRTNYFETLPARELELALWLESDRMGFFLGGITQEKLDNQREVVKNERRWRVDNQPYGTWLERGLDALFPPGHPYHWPVIGYMEDLDAARLEDVQEFFRTWYVPNNAVLSVVGDVETEAAIAAVQRYFGEIPRGPEPPRVDVRLEPPARERRRTIEDQVPLPRIYALYAVPAFGAPGYYPLDFAGDLLSAGKSSRLYRRLVHDLEIAKDVAAFTLNTEEVGVMAVVATPREADQLDRLERALDEELEELRAKPPGEAEMTRTLNRIETAFIGRLESAEHKADLLSMYATYFDDPARITTEIERYRAVTPGAVRAAAARWLDPDHRVWLRYVPRGSRPVEAAVQVPGIGGERARVPPGGPARPYRFPRPERVVLPNGLKVVASRLDKIPIVSCAALCDAGAARDPRGSAGLAALTASLLDEGTERRSSIAMAEELESLGAALSVGAEMDAATVALTCLDRNFAAAFDVAADALAGSTFPQREFDRLRAEQAAQVLENRANPGELADELIERLLYGTHPYAAPVIGDEASLAGLTRDDAAGFAARHLRPDTTRLVVVGSLAPDDVVREVERALGAWRRTGPALPPIPAPVPATGRRVYLVDRPGSTQSELRLGNLALHRASPDYTAANVMNGILGGKFTSRINLNLRERHGYTYGARTWFAARRVDGPFLVATAVEADATVPALRELFLEMERIRREPVSRAELDDTRSYLEGVFPLTVETTGDLVNRLADIELYGLPDDYFDRYRERIAAVDLDTVRDMAARHVRPDDMVVLVVGPGAAFADALGEIGPVTRLDDRGEPLPA